MQGSSWHDSPIIGPIALSVYVCIVALSGFLLGLKGLPWWYQLLTGAAALLAVGGLWLTFLSDPGALAPAASQDALVEQLDAGLPVPDAHLYSRDARGTWMKRTAQQPGGQLGYTKYCTTCHIWRPPRAHHCSMCGVCMERWDHHCGVVGNCIAVDNHRFFAGFLCSAQVGCLLLLGGAIWRLERRGLPNPGVWMGTESLLLIFLAVIYGYHAMVLLFGTSHCLGIALDITTKDLLTDRQLWRSPPCCSNARSPPNLVASWHRVCCGPVRLRQQHTWRALPAEEAPTAAAPAVAGSNSGSNYNNHSGISGSRLTQLEVAGSSRVGQQQLSVSIV